MLADHRSWARAARLLVLLDVWHRREVAAAAALRAHGLLDVRHGSAAGRSAGAGAPDGAPHTVGAKQGQRFHWRDGAAAGRTREPQPAPGKGPPAREQQGALRRSVVSP